MPGFKTSTVQNDSQKKKEKQAGRKVKKKRTFRMKNESKHEKPF